MRDSKELELSKYRYSLANETLSVAKSCFESGAYRDCINRSYYASFYAINAILALDSVGFKKHKSVIGYFNKEYIAKNILPKALGRKLNELKNMREVGDYTDYFIVSKDDAQEQLTTAEYVISLIGTYLNEKED